MKGDRAARPQSIWEEVLCKALQDYARGPDEQEIQDYIFCAQEDAEQWLMSESIAPGSFIWVCNMLGLEPSAVRKQAREERGLATTSE